MTKTADLTQQQLGEIRDLLTQRVREGLAQPDQEVLALPAYLKPPSQDLSGQALVVDAGGTNMRAAWLKLHDSVEIAAGPKSGTLPDGRDRKVEADEFFKGQADLVKALGAPENLPLGYCFSYPAEIVPTGDARLLRWSKSIQVEGVVGTMVGAKLSEAIGSIKQVKVLNDTVAALMGGAFAGRSEHSHFIGLIAGTGTNMAFFVPTSHITKLSNGSDFGPEMAINLESGNFSPPHLCAWDDAVDKASVDPGRGRFEKAVSGFYLPYVFAQLCPGVAGFDPRKGTGQLVEIRQKAEPGPAHDAACYVLDRSADLVAAGLAALFPFFGDAGSVGIQAEGGLFWGAPGFSDRVESTLKKLLPADARFAILRQENVNLVGAACAALT